METWNMLLQSILASRDAYRDVFIAFLRYFAPVAGGLVLLRAALPLLTFRREPEIWAWLTMHGGKQVPVTHWENVIGRSKSSDIVVDIPTASRNHAVLTRYDDGSWTITDAGSRDGTYVNGEPVRICALQDGDVITIGGIKMKFQPSGRSFCSPSCGQKLPTV